MPHSPGHPPPRTPPRLPSAFVIPGGDAAWEAVLRELPDPAALAAWETLRYLRLWVETEPSRRGGLFRRGAHARRELELIHQTFDLDLVAPLSALAGLLEEGDPDPKPVIWACLCMADWANLRGAHITGGLFAETAALVAPHNPGLAFVAGRMARAACQGWKAERWLKRAAAVAWRVGEWEVYTRSVNSLGNLRTEQGRLSEAEKILAKALRASQRHKLNTLQGEILHDLAVIAIASGHTRQAEQLVRGAFRVYCRGHHRLPALAYDVAYHWMNEGYFARALSVFRVLLDLFKDPLRRLQVIAAMARATGACEQLAHFQKLWIEAAQLTHLQVCQGVLGAALLDLGRGASSLGEWDHANEALSTALKIGEERGEEDVQAQAESALKQVRLKRTAEMAPHRPPLRGESQGDSFAKELVAALKGAAADCEV